MKVIGNIRKMRASLDANQNVNYTFITYNNLEKGAETPLNDFIGKDIALRFQHQINCTVTGEKINKTFGDGMSYDAFMNSPMAVPSIIRPELSQIHEGIALRDEEWERKHHLTPHCVYLSKTSGVKVGVTRKTQIPTRWIDQGAVEAMVIAETPYRQAAGLIEVALKKYISDKTSWQRMLKNDLSDLSIDEAKEYILDYVPEELEEFILYREPLQELHFPVLEYPEKVKSMKLDKVPIIEKRLNGIKGQYLLFADNTVINIRSHAGYLVELEF